MWRSGGRGLSRQLRRVVAKSTSLQAYGGQFRVVAAAGVTPCSMVASCNNSEQVSVSLETEPIHMTISSPCRKTGLLYHMQEHIEKDVKENPFLVYMKGVPGAPQCGFSAMVRILDEYDPINWSTIPQVYVNGKFVGGSDILISMHRSGELEKSLKDAKKWS